MVQALLSGEYNITVYILGRTFIKAMKKLIPSKMPSEIFHDCGRNQPSLNVTFHSFQLF
jgi:hypothetical protein